MKPSEFRDKVAERLGSDSLIDVLVNGESFVRGKGFLVGVKVIYNDTKFPWDLADEHLVKLVSAPIGVSGERGWDVVESEIETKTEMFSISGRQYLALSLVFGPSAQVVSD